MVRSYREGVNVVERRASRPDDMRDGLADVSDRLDRLLHAVLRADAVESVHPAHAASAVNLAHFVAMRSSDLRELQGQLAQLGLSSLGRSEAHVLATILAVRTALDALQNSPTEQHDLGAAPSFDEGRELLATKAAALLGPEPAERTTRIMVTLPSEVRHRPELVQELVDLGMDIARINCAHDDLAVWETMAGLVRAAATNAGREVRILMDLAGPKLRTGPIRPGAAVVKLRPRRDVFGRVLAPVRARLVDTTQTVDAGRAAAGGGSADERVGPVVPVELEFLHSLAYGDAIHLRDARDAARWLTVVEVDDTGVTVEAHHTIYLVPGLVLETERGRPCGTVGPLPHRPGLIPLSCGDLVELVAADDDELLGEALAAGGCRIGCTLPEAVAALEVGDRVFLDDGLFGGIVELVDDGAAWVRITSAPPGGGKLKAQKGINLPDTHVPVDVLTAKDLADLPSIVRLADMVALSFVRSPADVELLQSALDLLDARSLGLVLKIETVEAFRSLPDILRVAMRGEHVGVMIARGDLAVEAGYERLAELQEEILWLCEAAHLPVIWATEVLDQLARTGRPSRSEITDAAMSERAECVMLNKGPHIPEAMRTLDDILRRMTEHQTKKRPLLRPLRSWALGPDGT